MTAVHVHSVQIDATADRIIATVRLHTSHPDTAVEETVERVQRHFDGNGFDGAQVAARLAERVAEVMTPNLWGDPLLALHLFVDHLRKALRA